MQEGQVIKNWGQARGYSGKSSKIENFFIVIDSPATKNLQVISKNDFKKVWEIWGKYLSGNVFRHDIRDECTRFSSYIISIYKKLKI